MKVQFLNRYESTEKEMSQDELINLVRDKYKYDFSIFSFRLELQSGVKEFYGDSVTIKII